MKDNEFVRCKLKQQEMEIHNLLDAKSRAELREWLMQNHKKETECWVVVKRGRPVDDDTFWYIDAVEEALCFGWIDSTTKKMADGVTARSFAHESHEVIGRISTRKDVAEWNG